MLVDKKNTFQEIVLAFVCTIYRVKSSIANLQIDNYSLGINDD